MSNNDDIVNKNNKKIINEFEKLMEHIKIQIDIAPSTSDYNNNYFRLKAIKDVITVLKNYPNDIKSGEQLKDVKGIGKNTIARINEIIKSGKLSEIKINTKDKNYSEYIEALQEIHGIGQKKAYELVIKYGIKSVEELKKAYKAGKIELNNIILTGLKYHGICQPKIPRDEVDKIYDYLLNITKKIDTSLMVTICGSYRRKKPFSNDIDVLLCHTGIKTKKDLQIKKNYLRKFVKVLKLDNFIIDDLTDSDYLIKYMGYCKYNNNPVRRIDIRYIPYQSYYAALIYFTGSDNFNKRTRSLAEQMGYKLNEYGLFKKVGSKYKMLRVTNEKDIFDYLNLEYIEPEKRI